jgi:glutaredoxin
MRDIVVYSQPGCGKCMVLMRALDSKGIVYMLEKDRGVVMKKAQEVGVMDLPIFVVDGEVYSGSNAVIVGKELEK